MKIINKIRFRLALWFVGMVMLLHAADGALSLVVFESGLKRTMDVGLEDLIAEIQPVVEIDDGRPSLDIWAGHARQRKDLIRATVQLYDSDKHLIKEYGPHGVTRLARGTLKGDHGAVRSMFAPIERNSVSAGYLQLQMPTDMYEDAINQFGIALIILAPVVAVAVGICAYVFSGAAVKPIEKTMLMLRRFVADAGHELNTPVATIEACLETVQDPSKIGDISSELFQMMKRASERLRHLSKDLIVLARIEDPESELHRTEVDLKEVVSTVVAEYEPLARTRQIAIDMEHFCDASIEAHEESIYEIFNNLIDNAIKYSPDRGKVSVGAEIKEQSLIITVSDNGHGIPSASVDHIFDRFYRADDSRTSSVGGSGLGLSIVKAAVERHGGSIAVESVEGEGTTFLISLTM